VARLVDWFRRFVEDAKLDGKRRMGEHELYFRTFWPGSVRPTATSPDKQDESDRTDKK